MQLTKGQVVCLNKALYGTKQAARCWWQHLMGILRRIGFKPNDKDLSTYHQGESRVNRRRLTSRRTA
ncbi:hypothetical protein O181_094138, partial [Austropuccinia psidii MF-1]|nr:hypothetical protein [Austropuccinia psidii MF-1]